MSGKVGGFSEEKDATSEIQEYCDQVKPELEKKMGTNFRTLKAVSFISQVVAGKNYIVKADTGCGFCVHVKIFVGLSHMNEPPRLMDYQSSKTLGEPIVYF